MMTDSTHPNQPSVQDYADKLLASHNIILHGAPGTGKTYLAKQIAAHLISDGATNDYAELTPEQQEQCGFVQFHPSYDYSDFVEGLRPVRSETGEIGFELRDGIFKGFCKNTISESQIADNSQSTNLDIIQEYYNANRSKNLYTKNYEKNNKKSFSIASCDQKKFIINTTSGQTNKEISIPIRDIEKLIENSPSKLDDAYNALGRSERNDGRGKYNVYRRDSYTYAIYKDIIDKYNIKLSKSLRYIFIIDEINRGEISKIFGELFYSLDPGYRGPAGAISTQYSNLHADPEEKFYIPENVYIIGTMNDIDRSVDTFDFAMRRRFRFINVDANTHTAMLNSLDPTVRYEAIHRMQSLNSAIDRTEGLNHHYHIGAAYFLKLKDINNDFDILWSDYLEPLLQDYVSGLYNSRDTMNSLEAAYHLRH